MPSCKIVGEKKIKTNVNIMDIYGNMHLTVRKPETRDDSFLRQKQFEILF